MLMRPLKYILVGHKLTNYLVHFLFLEYKLFCNKLLIQLKTSSLKLVATSIKFQMSLKPIFDHMLCCLVLYFCPRMTAQAYEKMTHLTKGKLN